MRRYEDCICEESRCAQCSLTCHGRDCRGAPANKIAWLRGRAGLTQTALAAAVNCPQQWVAKLESEKISAENITLKKAIALAAALGVDVQELLD